MCNEREAGDKEDTLASGSGGRRDGGPCAEAGRAALGGERDRGHSVCRDEIFPRPPAGLSLGQALGNFVESKASVHLNPLLGTGQG